MALLGLLLSLVARVGGQPDAANTAGTFSLVLLAGSLVAFALVGGRK